VWLQQLHVYTPCDLFWKYLPAISPHAPISLSATDAKRYYEASIEALLTIKAYLEGGLAARELKDRWQHAKRAARK
jgi:hypothetical protein